MPIYEYICRKCDEKFEELVRSRKQRIKCPECGGAKVDKQFSLFGMKSSGSPSSSSSGGCSSCTPKSPGNCSSCSGG